MQCRELEPRTTWREMMAVSTNKDAVWQGWRATSSLTRRRLVGHVSAVTGAVAALLVVSASAGAAAPTCSDSEIVDVAVHGEHVVGDYVTGMGHEALVWPPPAGQVGAAVAGRGPAVTGGPGPGFHFVYGVAPGASFCVPQSSSPGSHGE